MNPKATYSHYEKLTGLTRILLPTLERIVPAAAIIANEQTLTSNQQAQLMDDLELMRLTGQSLQKSYSRVADQSSAEKRFVCIVTGGGLNNLLSAFTSYASIPDDPGMARMMEPSLLHPYFRLYNDSFRLDEAGVAIKLGGNRAEDSNAYFKTVSLPANVIGINEAVYGLVFSALLLADATQQEIALDFTARAEGETGFIEVENKDGVFADHLAGMIDKPETRPTFLTPAFAAGMSVHGTTISVPFQIAQPT